MPPVAAPPPPAAPAKPAAAPAQPPPNAPPPAPLKDGGPVTMDDIGAELDALDDTPRSAPKPEKKAVTPPADKGKKETATPEPPDADPMYAELKAQHEAEKGKKPEAPDKGKPVEKPADKPKDEPVKAADLRAAYEGLKKRVRDEHEPKVAKLEARIKELETRKPEDHEPIIKEMEAIKKRNAELESEIKYKDYQKSKEFVETYEKPYQEAWQRAMADLSELTVSDDAGNTRPAEAADLLQVANLPLGEARRRARELFGESADDIMMHRSKIRDLFSKQDEALKNAKTNAVEQDKKTQAERQIQFEQTIKQWKEANGQLAERFPRWFAPEEGDTEGNALLSKGFALADLHFTSPKDLSPEQVELLPGFARDAIKLRGNLNIGERVKLDALLRNKIASHDRLALRLKKASERIKELEGSLKEYEDSAPPGGRAGEGRAGGPAGHTMSDAESELDRIDRENS